MDLSLIDPELDRLINPRPRMRSQTPFPEQAPSSPRLDDSEQKSMVASLRDNAVSGLGALGNLLDVPGSITRDLISSIGGNFNNPLDQLLSPFSSENRTTGRDLARQYGLAGTEDTWANAIGGFGAEVALDPLTYLTFGASALGKSGKAARAAGLMDDVAKVAAAKAGKQLGQVGAREARLSTALEDFVTHGSPEVASKAKQLIDEGADAAEPLGGLFGAGLPFRDPSFVGGTGAKSVRVAKALDNAASTIRFARVPGTDLQPVNSLARLFSAKINSTSTPLGQAVARNHWNELRGIESNARDTLANYAQILADGGVLTDEAASAMRMRDALEAISPLELLTNDAERNVARSMKGQIDAMPITAQHWGVKLQPFVDSEIDYFPRRVSETRRRPGNKDLRSPSIDPTDVDTSRKDFLQNVPGGTNAIRSIANNEELERLITNGANSEQLAAHLRDTHPWLPDTFNQRSPNGLAEPATGRHQLMADWLAGLAPDTRKSGVFGNNPVMDFHARRMSFDRAVQGAKTIRDALAEPDVLRPAGTFPAGHSVKLDAFLKETGLDAGDGATNGFLARLKESLPNADLSKMELDKNHAKDLRSFMESLKGPEPLNGWVHALDNITNFSKAMWTGIWPAFHTRNLLSGQVHNFLLGMGDPQSVVDAHSMLRGGVVKDAKDLPAIREAATKQFGNSASFDFRLSNNAILNRPDGFTVNMNTPDGKQFGTIIGDVQPNALQVRNTGIDDPAMLGKGYAAEAYEDLFHQAKQMGKVLTSDVEVTPDIVRVYDSLKRRGYDVQSNPLATLEDGKLITPKGKGPVFTVVDGPAIKPRMRADRLDDIEATKLLGRLAYSHGLLGKFETNASTIAGESVPVGGQVSDVLAELLRPGSSKVSATSVARKATGIDPSTSWNPINVRGVGGRESSTFAPAAAGEEVGHYVEGLNRIAPFLNQLKKGIDPAEAAERVGAAQVKYGNVNYTPVERQFMRRLFPFYSFTSRTAKRIAEELTQRPGGALSQTIRASNSSGKNDLVPDYVRETSPIPINDNPFLEMMFGKAPQGTNRYLTGFGLMHEDPLSFGLSPRSIGMEALSRTNPMLKGPLEMITGRSFNSRTSDGTGRRLDSIDPTLGRLMANVAGKSQPVETPLWIEQLLNNSPASVALNRAKALTDTRKRLGDTPLPGPAALVNALTGIRVTDISPEQRQRTLEGLVDERLRDHGAKTFERTYIPKTKELSDKQRMEIAKLQQILRAVNR